MSDLPITIFTIFAPLTVYHFTILETLHALPLYRAYHIAAPPTGFLPPANQSVPFLRPFRFYHFTPAPLPGSQVLPLYHFGALPPLPFYHACGPTGFTI